MAYLRKYLCEVCDFHGAKHVAGQGGLLRRLIWLIFCLASIVAFLYQTTQLFEYFYARHHVTKVDVSFNNKLEFPAVTVCNFNKYRESALTEEDIKNVGVHLGITDEDYNLIYPDLYTAEFRDKITDVNWSTIQENEDYNMTDFQLRTGHELQDMIINCTWKGDPCSHENFTHVFTHLGNCYTFNQYAPGYERHTSLAAGSANGLRLMLDIEEPEYVASNDLDGGAIDSGIMVMVHSPTEPPYVREFALPASPGHHTFIVVQHEKITALPDPYTKCEEDGEMQYFDHYSLQACRIECETDIVTAECGCKLVEQPGKHRVCNPKETHECAHPSLERAIHGVSETGSCDCSSPCVAEVYPMTVSGTKLRSTFVEKLFQQGSSFNHSAAYIESNVVVLSIYYEALNYEVIEQLPALDTITLLATIGGNLGLFTGASLLTIIQLLEYLIDEFLTSCGCTRDNERDEMAACCGCTKNNKTDDSHKISAGNDLNVVNAWPSS